MTLSGVAVEAVKTALVFILFPLPPLANNPPFLFPLWQSQHEIPRELCSVDKYIEWREEGDVHGRNGGMRRNRGIGEGKREILRV